MDLAPRAQRAAARGRSRIPDHGRAACGIAAPVRAPPQLPDPRHARTIALRRPAGMFEALRSPWAVFGAVAIGLYVGAEVSIGSIMINFLNQRSVLGAAVR